MFPWGAYPHLGPLRQTERLCSAPVPRRKRRQGTAALHRIGIEVSITEKTDMNKKGICQPQQLELGALLLIVMCIMCVAVSAQAVTTVNATNKWAWASGSGWINCRTDSTNGAVIGEFVCSGYLWSSGTGWINIGDGTPTNGIRYTGTADDYGVNHDGKGNLTGWAWSGSVGWINFEHSYTNTRVKINFATGKVGGYAWNSSIGWISFDNLQGYVETDTITTGPDTNTNSIPDNWELSETGQLGLFSGGTNDYDGDGFTDYEEYLAGTSGTNASDRLLMTAFTHNPTATNFSLAWKSKETRVYRVEKNDSLMNSTGWVEYAVYTSWVGSSTEISLPVNVNSQVFYRVNAMLPGSN